MSPQKTLDILCFGEPLAELNQQDDGSYLAGHGGDVSNCAISAARQGAKVGMLAHIGQDRFGQDFLSLWQDEQIDCQSVSQSPHHPTGMYFVTHGPDGHEFSYYRKGSASAMIHPDDLPIQALACTKILHVSGISQAISTNAADSVFEAINQTRTAGGLISYDSNLRLKLWPLTRARAITHEAMSQCDIALPGLEDAELLTGLNDPDKIADFYLTLGAKIVALTLGPKGTLVATTDKRLVVPGIPVKAIDATGAGDTFDGAFLADYVIHQDPFKAARYANAAAALAVQGYGAVAPMPKRSVVTEFLAQNS